MAKMDNIKFLSDLEVYKGKITLTQDHLEEGYEEGYRVTNDFIASEDMSNYLINSLSYQGLVDNLELHASETVLQAFRCEQEPFYIEFSDGSYIQIENESSFDYLVHHSADGEEFRLRLDNTDGVEYSGPIDMTVNAHLVNPSEYIFRDTYSNEHDFYRITNMQASKKTMIETTISCALGIDPETKSFQINSAPVVTYDKETNKLNIGDEAANVVSNIQNGTGEASVQQVNAIAAGKNSSAFGKSDIQYKADNTISTEVQVVRGYNSNTEELIIKTYGTDGPGSGSTGDLTPEEDPDADSVMYYKDGNQILSTFSIEFDSTGAVGENSFTAGEETLAAGKNSKATGWHTYAGANYTSTEGSDTIAIGEDSHAEGLKNMSVGQASHTEGMRNTAEGKNSHAEGLKNHTSTNAVNSHVEGSYNNCRSSNTHVEGMWNVAVGSAAHAHIEGEENITDAKNSHIEGYKNKISGSYTKNINGDDKTFYSEGAHIEGGNNSILTTSENQVGKYAHVEGYANIAKAANAHVEGTGNSVTGINGHAEGEQNQVIGLAAHAEGHAGVAYGDYSHSEGSQQQVFDANDNLNYNVAVNISPSTQQLISITPSTTGAIGLGSHAEGFLTVAQGSYSHAEGHKNYTKGNFSHAEGETNYAEGIGSHAEGKVTRSSGEYSHSEGYKTLASGNNSHAEGSQTNATNEFSHAEGRLTKATGAAAHAEGRNTVAEGIDSHAEGSGTNALGKYSHSEGRYTIAQGDSQHVQGKYNIVDSNNTYAHIVGGGDENTPKNIHTLDWNGNAWFAENVYVGGNSGTNRDEGSKRLLTEDDLKDFAGSGGSSWKYGSTIPGNHYTWLNKNKPSEIVCTMRFTNDNDDDSYQIPTSHLVKTENDNYIGYGELLSLDENDCALIKETGEISLSPWGSTDFYFYFMGYDSEGYFEYALDTMEISLNILAYRE